MPAYIPKEMAGTYYTLHERQVGRVWNLPLPV